MAHQQQVPAGSLSGLEDALRHEEVPGVVLLAALLGRVLQLVTGSTGLDDYEWGVTLFGLNPDVIKEVVYTMRFDEGSALYGEFGAFYVGYLDDVENLV